MIKDLLLTTWYERKGNGGGVMQSLSEVKAGAVCTIKWMFGNPQVMEFMHQHDIRRKYHQCVPAWKGQHDNRMNNIRLAIGNEVTERIKEM